MNMDNFFGKDLKLLRRDKCITQAELAHATHLNRTYISMLERGLRHPSLETVLKISHALGVNAGDLVDTVDQQANSRSHK